MILSGTKIRIPWTWNTQTCDVYRNSTRRVDWLSTPHGLLTGPAKLPTRAFGRYFWVGSRHGGSDMILGDAPPCTIPALEAKQLYSVS